MGGLRPKENKNLTCIVSKSQTDFTRACTVADKEKARLAPGSWLFGVLNQDRQDDSQKNDGRN